MNSWQKKLAAFRIKKDKREWDGNCHGCQMRIMQENVARIGPYWICDNCISAHFPEDKYTVNDAADILENIRGFK